MTFFFIDKPLEGIRRSTRTRKQTQSSASRLFAVLEYEKQYKEKNKSKRAATIPDLSTIAELDEQLNHQNKRATKPKRKQTIKINEQKSIDALKKTMSIKDFDSGRMIFQNKGMY